MQKADWTDDEILAALLAGGSARRLAWEFIFKNWRNRYLMKIKHLGGTVQEADEALGAMCITWERTVTRPDFVLKTASLGWYFDKSLIHSWKRLQQRKIDNFVSLDENTQNPDPFEGNLETDLLISEILDSALEKSIGKHCRTILLLFAQQYSMGEIGEAMDITTDSAKNQKSRCLRRLEKYFEEHPEIKLRLKNLIYG